MKKLSLKLPPYLPTVIVTAIILYLTLAPHPLPDDTPTLPHADKAVHAVMFGTLFCAMAFDRARQQLASGQDTRLSRRCLTTVMSVTLAMGGGVEIAQTLMDMGRGGDIYDFIADAAGALLALASHSRVNRYFLGK